MNVYKRRWAALLVLCLSLVIVVMDNIILNVALPTLARDLQTTGSDLQWIVDAYVLVFAGLVLTMGALGDRFGRKLALYAGLLLFTAASIAAALAVSPEALIASRAGMGMGGALVMPATLSIITSVFPASERARAIGVWAGVAGLGIVLGPVAAGWLLERFWWGSVFLANVPLVTVTMIAGWTLIPESRDPRASPLDPVGAGLSTVGLVALVYGIIEAPENGWTGTITLGAFLIAALLLTGFIAWEIRVEHPILRMEFFRHPRFTVGSLAISLTFFVLFGLVFLLTQHLQFVLGYTPLQAGLRIMPLAVLMFVAPLSTRLVASAGTKIVVFAGLAVLAGALLLLSGVGPMSDYAPVAWSLFVFGIGVGLVMPPATDSIMGSLPPAKAGVGSAMNDTTRMIGGALGVAVLGSVLASSYRSAIERSLREAPPEVADVAGDSIVGAWTIAAELGAQGQGLLDVARSGFIHGMGDALLVGAGATVLGAVLVLLFLPATE